LLQPLWLAAMAGIAFPVLLHLWNDRRGRVLPVGSVALLERGSPRQTWSRRLSEWWLLLLRCLLLMALAMLLAGPSWKRGVAGAGKKGWILVEGGAGSPARTEAERLCKPMIDSLLKAGYERHEWDTLAGVEGLSYWDAFRAADRTAPAGTAFYIFSSAWANRFRGSRPFTGRPVHWYTYTPADSVIRWTGGAWMASPDSVRMVYGSSRPTGTSYSYQTVAPRSLSTGDLTAGVDTAILRIIIYTDADRIQDGRYLAAAVRALEQFGRRRVQWVVTGSLPVRGAGKPDWLFWLSSMPMPVGEWAERLFRYEPGPAIPADTWMQGVEGVDIRKEVERMASSDTAGAVLNYETVWKDGYGRSLLGRERTSHGMVYHFFSRFDPEWNGLAWSRTFPVLLEGLLCDGQDRSAGRDRRVLDPEQIAPVYVSGASREANVRETSREANAGETVDLRPIVWGIVFILFFLERIKAYGNGSRKA
jgi:hypothetical protein